MSPEIIIVLLAVLLAIAYLAYRAKQAFDGMHDPCKGCPGCALKGKTMAKRQYRTNKKHCEEIKSGKKFGGTK